MAQAKKKALKAAEVGKLVGKALTKCADFFEKNPDRWIQGQNATDANGKKVDACSTKAKCFCMHGRMQKEFRKHVEPHLPETQFGLAWDFMKTEVRTVVTKKNPRFIAEFNDRKGRKVVQVVDAFRKAADRASHVLK